jgi:uncharacterized membrane protein YhhN
MSLLKNDRLNGIIYGTATLGTIISGITGSHTLMFVCKPLLMLVLSSWFFFKSRRVGDRFTLLVQAGLFFSWIGDIALMYQFRDEFFFLIGLGAFLITQLCYVIAFSGNLVHGDARWPLAIWALVLLLVSFGAAVILLLVPSVDEAVRLPVTIYVCTITAMGVTATLRYSRTYLRSFVMILCGALLFITSDSILAWNRFMHPIAHASWSVMLTYSAAQYLIAAGALAHVLAPDEIRRRAALST